ncbi:MAG: hypothetical protein GF421_06440 [Candidatus Aminicenantes bacterium]|nr:hypothetical protein [Candidatus Aminicenantes bacterium]
MIKNLISLEKISIYQFSELLDLTLEIKEKPHRYKNSLSGCTVAGIFQNPYFLTQVCFQVAVTSLKGQPLIMKNTHIQTQSQNLSEIACQCLDQWMDGIFIETKNHGHIIELDKFLTIPVANAHSEIHSPCQAIADFLTIKENHRDLTSIKLALIGNQKNIGHSLLLASSLSGASIHIASPKEKQPDPQVLEAAEVNGKQTGFQYEISEEPQKAISNADIIYYSYPNQNPSLFNSILMNSKQDALFMTSMFPEEWKENRIQNIPSKRRLFFRQADNRLHILKAIMVSLIRKKK